jgi:putative peptide zinc metalloprotease protein
MSIGEVILSLPKGCSLWEIDTSFLEKQWLLLTPNKRKFHVSAKASDVLSEIIEEQKSLAEIASSLSKRWHTEVTPEDVLAITDAAHWPDNLIRKLTPCDKPQVIEEAVEERNGQYKSSELDFFFRFTVVPSRWVNQIATLLQSLYKLPTVLAIGLMAVLVHVQIFRLLFSVPSWTTYLKVSPAEYVAAFCIIILSVIFHELGHATASARFRVKPGDIGFGIYFIYPALYTELGSAWLLPRMKRAVIDVGGFYFQLLATIPLYLAFLLTHDNLYLLTIVVNDFLIIFSLNPFFKFDGYWLLSDLLGVPNLQKRGAELLRKPLEVIRTREFTTRSGLKLPRPIASSLLLYGLLSVLFRIMMTYFVFKNGPRLILQAPSTIVGMTGNIMDNLSAGEYFSAIQEGIKAFTFSITIIALLFIFKAYAKSFWRLTKQTGQRLATKIKSGHSEKVITEGSFNP